MEQVSKRISKELPSVMVHIDQLEEINTFLEKEFDIVEITAELDGNKYVLNTFEDLKTKKAKNVELTISAKSNDKAGYVNWENSLECYIKGHRISVWFHDNSLKCFGAFGKIESILLRHRRKFWDLVGSRIFQYFFLGLFGVTLNLKNALGMATPVLCIFIAMFPLFVGQKVLLVFQESFWERNKDQLITGSISAIFGAILGVLLTVFFLK